MTPWLRGADEVRLFIEQGELEIVQPSDELAGQLLTQSALDVESAEAILYPNPKGALGLAYDAARQSATALLVVQGLRPTTRGGHVAVQNAVAAQFNGPFRMFSRHRRMRNEHQYPRQETAPVTRGTLKTLSSSRPNVSTRRRSFWIRGPSHRGAGDDRVYPGPRTQDLAG